MFDDRKLQMIPISKIRENPESLRSVDLTSEEYLGLVDSVRAKGILNPISVREIKGAQNGEVLFGLIDGLHRFTAAKDAGLNTVPAQVMSMEQAEIYEAQILANVHKVETKKAEYANQLSRILQANPLLTKYELSDRLKKSPTWLDNIVGLTNLTKDIQGLVNEGKIIFANAIQLSKLPEEEQPNWVDRAMTQGSSEFVPSCNARAKEIRYAKRKGKDAPPEAYIHTPHLRKLAEIKEERTSLAWAKKNNIKDLETWKLCLDWTSKTDAQSVEEGRKADEKRRLQLKEQKEKEKIEKAEQRAKDAQATALHLQEEAKKHSKQPVLAGS